jgi:hypothetical protein
MNPKNTNLDSNPDANRDPITGAPGSHPVGTGVGALAGGIASGAAIGTMAGPVGTAIGAAVGAVVGGLAGHSVAEMIDPTAEDAYWRANYEKQDYVAAGSTYDDYGPAYRYGVDSYKKLGDGNSFDDVEGDLQRDWEGNRADSSLTWDRAKYATRDSWQRVSDAVERAVPGDSDHDGK